MEEYGCELGTVTWATGSSSGYLTTASNTLPVLCEFHCRCFLPHWLSLFQDTLVFVASILLLLLCSCLVLESSNSGVIE